MSPDIKNSVDNTFILIFSISVILLLIVTVTMITFVIKYNKKRHPVADKDIHGHTLLEILWTLIPTALALLMFFSGYSGFKLMRTVPKDSYVIKVTGRQWQWNYEYPNGKKYDTLYVPDNQPVKLELNSTDVNHSFYIPQLRIKEDVIPGRTNYLWFKTNEVGEYVVECAEYCGLSHAYMLSKIISIPQQDFEKWVNYLPPADTIKKDTTKIKN
jgi:cytochrome c oxidase subunit 2